MNKTYEAPTVNILSVNIPDVITASPVVGDTWLDWLDMNTTDSDNTYKL